MSAPILQMLQASVVLKVDAPDVGVGGVLSQRSSTEQKLHPCAFFLRRLSLAEKNYDIGNRELEEPGICLRIFCFINGK